MTEPVRRRAHVPTVLLVLLALVAAAAGGFSLGRGSAPDTTALATPGPPGPTSVEVGFSQDMAVHHEQAVLMATLAQTRATTPVRTIANGILGGQSQELGALRGWLRLWGEPAVDPHPMAWMTGMQGMAGMHAMPGMATSGQLSRLAGLEGRRFDVLFLQLMIRHHQGGIQMAADARQHARLAVVRDAAASMIVQQVEDLGAMRALLRADGGRPLPAPH
ncbi:DUF305 domain-containing protein [Nocardioides ultimimeridianus]